MVILDDTVPNILKNSSRREILFPDLPSETAAAICLARFAQEPLSEYCSIWRSVDSSYLFGYEVLYMKLHPLQVRIFFAISICLIFIIMLEICIKRKIG